ncbi:hypothetical protein B0H13DRAFT_2394206 [Mycena leptocephala]|nr:hypothetical protein B0H13DRAFT_2394206 [Mycena leptocephala]
MKDLNTFPTSAIPRSVTLSRFRPISLPIYLDYKIAPKRRLPAPLLHPAHPPPLRPSAPPLQTHPVPAFPTPYPHPRSNESRCCQMLIHGLFVAFEDDFVESGTPRPEGLRADGGREFTHFISLSARHKAPIKHTVDRKSGVKRLKLRLPRLYSPIAPTPEELAEKLAAAREAAEAEEIVLSQDDYYDILFDEGEGSRFTGLEALQLLAARDFLYGTGLAADSESVRVLVTTPRDHRTDAIAAVMGYLSLVLRCRVAKVLRTQDNHPRILGIWKDTVSAECAEFIEEIAY